MRHPLAGADGWEGVDDSDLIPVALGFDLANRETVFLVEESDVLDQAGKAFGELFCRLWLQVTGMMCLFAGCEQGCGTSAICLSNCGRRWMVEASSTPFDSTGTASYKYLPGEMKSAGARQLVATV